MKRPTIADVARQAGVTKAAVSFALNGQPGVSAATRERILAIAEQVGFKPSSAARALSDGRSGAVGLIIDRPALTLGIEPYFMQLISGIQAELSAHHVTLLFTMAEDQAAEIEMYRTWWAQRKVDGVFLVDLQVRDRRVPVLRELSIPAVAVGHPRGADGLPAVWQDDRAATTMVVGHLAGHGHSKIARVGGFPRYWHSKLRTDAFAKVAEAAGLEAVSVAADYTAEHGVEATLALLDGPEPPTAILYDNDVMAVAALGAVQRAGLAVPGDLSIVAWGDSALCELVHPAVTALRWDTVEAGTRAARLLNLAIEGAAAEGPGKSGTAAEGPGKSGTAAEGPGKSGTEVGDFQEGPPKLMVRESTGQPRAGPPLA